MNQLPATGTAAHPPVYEPYDEISLVDVARVIWRHRRAALAALLVSVVAAVALALLTPKKYAYTTTIEIGSRVEDGRAVPIETSDTALAKLRESYVPQARRRYLEAHPEAKKRFAVEVRVPKGSRLLVLESTAPEEDGAAYRHVQEQAVQALVADHAPVLESQRSAIELDKQRAERNLQTLVDEETALKARLERLESKAQLLDQQIADARALIEDATANRRRAAVEGRDAARAMTLLMLDNEVWENRVRLAELQRQRQIDLAEERDGLDNALRENRRDQASRQAELRQLDLQLKNLQETRAVVLGMQSLEPVGISRALMVLVGILLGGLLALLVPLVLEFLGRVKEGLDSAPAGDQVAGAVD